MIVEKATFRLDFVTRLSYLASRHSLEPRPRPSSVHSFFFFDRPTDPPSQETGRWETKHFIGMAYAEEITFALACVQTSPLPQKTHGGGTSVHRLPLHLKYFRLKNL